MQYKTGTVDVTNGSATVTGNSTAFLTNVSVGDDFLRTSDGVVYDIAAVVSDTQITLSVPYQGVTGSAVTYTIQRDFTANYGFPYLNQGDIETATITARATKEIDAIVSSKTGLATTTTPGIIEKATADEMYYGTADKYPDAAAVRDVISAGFSDPGANLVWDSVSDTFSRQFYTTGVSPIHERIRRCLLLDDGTVNYYLDANDSTLQEDGVTPAVLDGTDGQVMVEVPKFYVRIHKLFTGEWKREISETPRSGFVVHPAFAIGGTLQYDDSVGMWHYKGNTGERDAFYVGAYQACVYDDSAATHINGLNLDDNTANIDTTTDLLASVNGFYPMVGVTRDECRSMASNRGTGWSQWLFWQLKAIQLLFFVEYGGFNSQALLANGNVSVSTGYPPSSADQLDSPHSVAGKSNTIGNGSGGVDSNARDTAWMSYRGIENLWGNAWQWCDGWNINDRVWYVRNEPSDLVDNTTSGYEQIGAQAPLSNGYIRDVQHSTLADVISDSSGGSTLGFADYYYQNTGWRVASVGGSALNGARAGVSCAFLYYVSGSAFRSISSRSAFTPN